MSETNNRLTQALAEVLSGEPQVLAAYHFGSSADGTAHASSDVDVGVLFRTRVPLEELIRIEIRLDDSIPQTVDLVDVKRAGPFVALEIIRGDRFFCCDETVTDEFDLYVLRRAGDLEYFERERRAFFLESPLLDSDRKGL
jgi:predicted nucleotidyltransferase